MFLGNAVVFNNGGGLKAYGHAHPVLAHLAQADRKCASATYFRSFYKSDYACIAAYSDRAGGC